MFTPKQRTVTKAISISRAGRTASPTVVMVSFVTLVRDVLRAAGVSADDHWLVQGYEILSPDDAVWPLVELGGFLITPATYF